MRKEKGITLIALIITVAIMIILVGVSIRFAIDGGLAGTTQKAAADTQNEVDYENMIAQGYVQKSDGTWVKLSGIGGTSGEGEGTGAGVDIVLPTGWTVSENKDATWSNSVTAITNGTNTIPLPTGFTVSQETGESTYSSGVVIKDSNDNEFVWIPYTETYVEEYLGNDTQGLADKEKIENTINKYEGFWIGRRIATKDDDIVGVKASGTPLLCCTEMYSEYYDDGSGWSGYAKIWRNGYTWNSLYDMMQSIVSGIDGVESLLASCRQIEFAYEFANLENSNRLEWTLTGLENEEENWFGNSKVFYNDTSITGPWVDSKGRLCMSLWGNGDDEVYNITNYSCRPCLILD